MDCTVIRNFYTRESFSGTFTFIDKTTWLLSKEEAIIALSSEFDSYKYLMELVEFKKKLKVEGKFIFFDPKIHDLMKRKEPIYVGFVFNYEIEGVTGTIELQISNENEEEVLYEFKFKENQQIIRYMKDHTCISKGNFL